MISEKFRYYKGSAKDREMIEMDEVKKDGTYITTCCVDVDLLLCGISTFPCGNGDDIKLKEEQQLKILEFIKEERKKITDKYPVKTYKRWHESGLRTFEDFCFPGDVVDEEMINSFVDNVPPVTYRSNCMQAGEAYNSEKDRTTGKYRSTYITFSKLRGSLWKFNGYCFKGKTTNQVKIITRLDRNILDIKRKVGYKK